jgi:hypothetical protein
VKVDCAACHHVALLTPEALLRVGSGPDRDRKAGLILCSEAQQIVSRGRRRDHPSSSSSAFASFRSGVSKPSVNQP